MSITIGLVTDTVRALNPDITEFHFTKRDGYFTFEGVSTIDGVEYWDSRAEYVNSFQQLTFQHWVVLGHDFCAELRKKGKAAFERRAGSIHAVRTLVA